MALSIPIISEFDGKGIDKAIKEFQQLETVGEKAQFAIKKAAVPAAAALAGIATGLGLATKAAIEDAAAQEQLAGVLERSAGATDAAVAANEEFISTLSRATATADDELRPALATLVTATGSLELSQSLLAKSQDIAASTGNDLATVIDAVSKAYNGNTKGLKALDPSLIDVIKSGASFEEIMAQLAVTTGGAATAAADTAAGKLKGLKISLDETKESIGAALLPALEAVLPYLQGVADWAQRNPKPFLVVAGTISAIALAIMGVNIAMALNPFGLIAVGTAAVITGLTILYTKFEGFRNVVNIVFNGIMAGMETFVNAFNTIINQIIYAYNLVNPFADVPSLPTNLILPRIGGAGPATSGGQAREGGTGSITPALPSMPSIGLPITGGGGGSRSGGGGGGGGGGVGGGGDLVTIQSAVPALTQFGIAERIAARGDVITVNVNGGIATSAEIGQSVYNSLLQYKQIYGPLDALAV